MCVLDFMFLVFTINEGVLFKLFLSTDACPRITNTKIRGTWILHIHICSYFINDVGNKVFYEASIISLQFVSVNIKLSKHNTNFPQGTKDTICKKDN